ncbi:phospholipase D-like domain-containing protein [Halarchaeum salinum]|uniref:phospholipase D-like domain-containing protein n=1 Tax=Halarchaeum salinum TaxID=489912 RepID=UPI001B8748A7
MVIVSPWLSDVTLRLPVNDRFDEREVRLATMLGELTDTDIRILVREGEEHNEYIERRLPNHVEFRVVEGLHAKAVVSDAFVYLGSANITRGGLSVNRELCEVLENEYGSAHEYVSSTLDINVED